jgi:hypothetical protein
MWKWLTMALASDASNLRSPDGGGWGCSGQVFRQCVEAVGRVPDGFVMSAGTGGTIAGVSCYLKVWGGGAGGSAADGDDRVGIRRRRRRRRTDEVEMPV